MNNSARSDPGDKLSAVRVAIRRSDGMAVAFSGGVDSTFLAAVAHAELGDRVLAVTAVSPLHPEHELLESRRLAERIGIRHETVVSNELAVPGFADNPPDRCYLCKNELFSAIRKAAARHGINAIADGTNADDSDDYRPGAKAAAEHGVMTPLLDAGLRKEEIRALSKQMGLPTAGKASSACLASRFPYGTRITEKKLAAVETLETELRETGFFQVRVRHHGDLARIEVGADETGRLLRADLRDRIVALCKKAGFLYVTVDLQGYRTGSMNETLKNERRRAGQ